MIHINHFKNMIFNIDLMARGIEFRWSSCGDKIPTKSKWKSSTRPKVGTTWFVLQLTLVEWWSWSTTLQCQNLVPTRASGTKLVPKALVGAKGPCWHQVWALLLGAQDLVSTSVNW
jgi:hypothetical protein